MSKNTSGLLPPWKPGQSGNPTGRPKKRPITDEYFQILGEPIPEEIRAMVNKQFNQEILQPGATWARAGAVRRVMDMIMPNGHPASKEIREAIEGKAPLRLEIQGTQRKEVTLKVIFERRTNTNQLSND
jgi:hypothetical protein